MPERGDSVAKILDKLNEVMGIFNNNTPKPEIDEEINTPDQMKLVEMAEYDYQVFKEKRQPIEDVWRREQRMYKGDHWNGLRPPDDGPYPERMEFVGNYAWSQIESITARLTGWVPTPDFEAMEEGDEDKAKMLNAFIPYELNCIKFKPKHIRAVRRMVIHGPIIYKPIYDPTFKGGRGNNRYNGQNDIIPVSLGTFFPDPAVKDFINLQKGRAHIFNNLLTLQFIRERWEEQGNKVLPENTSNDTEIFDIDSETAVGTSYNSENNQTTANVLEYWYKGKPKYMSDEDKKLFKELAAEKLSEGIDPSELLAKSAGEMDGIHCLYVTSKVFLEHKSYVYDHGQYPIVARTLFPEENNPWGKGYMRDLISPQTMLNRFCELAIEVTSKMGNAAIVYGTGALLESVKNLWKKYRSQAGAMLQVPGDVQQVKELQGVPPNPGIMQYIEFFITMMQRIPGMFDSSNGAANANVTSGRQSEALINAAQGRLSLAAELIEDAVQEVIEQFIALCAQFYTTERVARITGKTMKFSRDSLISRAETDDPRLQPNGEPMMQDIGNGMMKPVMIEEEYVPMFDIKVSIGVEKPKDREYFVQMALNLFKTIDPTTGMPCIDAQAVKYTVENGRMEPMSVIEERMQVAQQQMMQMQQLQQQLEQLQGENQVMMEMLMESGQGEAAGQAEAMKQEGEAAKMNMQAQQQEHSQKMDVAKLDLEARKIDAMRQKQTV